MVVRIKAMTKSELRQYVEAYHPFFSNWIAVRGECFLRISGPVAQQVWFENLRSGAYRPVTAVSILVAKKAVMLHKFLDIRHREILPREHQLKFEEVFNAMRDQFVPSIISPLNAIEVCQLCEEHAVERVNEAHSLSALNAYLGKFDTARKWIDILKRLTNDRTEIEDWEKDCVRALNSLEEAIESDKVKVVLDEIRLSEESRLLRG